MIISDKHKFCFIHIPKCAGTTLRNVLQEYDNTAGSFTNRVDRHLPLFVLEEHFSAEYEKVCAYQSFAIVRDPFSRFRSSVSQRINRHGKKSIGSMNKVELKEAIDTTIKFLSSYSEKKVLPPDYIHFQRQSTYIYNGNIKVVNNVFPSDRVDLALKKIGNLVGNDLHQAMNEAGNKNQTLVYKSEIIRLLMNFSRPVLINPIKKITNRSFIENVQSKLYVPRDQKVSGLFQSDYVDQFIKSYYKRDMEIYQSIYSEPNP